MRAKLKGEQDLMKQLEKRLGKRKMLRITDDALIAGGNKVASIIEKDMYSARGQGTGKSARATSVSKPETIAGTRTVKIHWNDGSERYRIIHLNEYGHFDKAGKWVNPTSKGVIENAMRQGRETYFATVKTGLAKRV